MKLLSVCLIVKNEEDTLERCLESVKEIADEIIVVDTGSTDRTKEIALRYTNLIYDFEWCDDFSKARNESIRRATCKWVLVIDADEYLTKDQLTKWKGFLMNEKPQKRTVYTVTVVNQYKNENLNLSITTAPVSRLFLNHQGVKFFRPIHEQLCDEQGELRHKPVNLQLYHTGYQAEIIEKKKKNKRNMTIFDNMLKNGRFIAYDYFTLGNQYVSEGDESKAIDSYLKALESGNGSTSWYPFCVMHLINLYTKSNKVNDSWKLITDELSKYQAYPEYHTTCGIHYEVFGFFAEAEKYYLRAIQLSEERAGRNEAAWLTSPEYGFDIPVTQLIHLYFRLNRNEEAIYWMSKLLQHNKLNAEILFRLIEWLIQHDHKENIISLLDRIYNLNDNYEATFLYRVILNTCDFELVNYYNKFKFESDQLLQNDVVELALINNDMTLISKMADQTDEFSLSQNSWIYTTAGALIWKNKNLLNLIKATSSYNDKEGFFDLIDRLFHEEKIESQLWEPWSKELFLIAQALFRTQQFETYDNLIQLAGNPELINMLANYFYKLGLHEMAFNYYSSLHASRGLNGLSLENLGIYSMNHGNTEDGVEFLAMALDHNPKVLHLYYPLIKYADSEMKQKYAQQFEDHFENYTAISFLSQEFQFESKPSLMK